LGWDRTEMPGDADFASLGMILGGILLAGIYGYLTLEELKKV